MRITQRTVVGISLFLLSASAVWAEDGNAQATASPPAVKTEPAATTTAATAGKGGAGSLKDAIVGTWKSVQDVEEMQFAADGTAQIKESNATFTATYKVLEDGRLHLEVPVFKKQKDLIYTVELKGDQMTLLFTGQKPRTYTRVK